MADIWTEFNISDHTADSTDIPRQSRLRRGWFYTGGGLPVADDGTLDEHSRMRTRVVAPATPEAYTLNVLNNWPAKDDRYRSFFLDASFRFYGKLVEIVHDEYLSENFILVGESIPQSNPDDFPVQAAARLGAPWFALTGVPTGPWWNRRDRENNPDHRTNIADGYNVAWATDWAIRPIYFGILSNGFLNLHRLGTEGQLDFARDDLSFGDIYRWVRKGATPVAWFGPTFRKVGAAFDYATGRLEVSRISSSPRLMRVARV